MARAYWKGQIRISLVSLPVELHSAVKSAATIGLHKIHEPTGKRVKYQDVVEGVGPVKKEDIIRGYEHGKNRYVLLEPGEIEEIRLESKKTIDIVQFVDVQEIPPLYFERPYYVVPDGDLAEEAYLIVRDALRETKKIGLGQLTLYGKESLIALKACGKGLLLETLRYEEEVRKAHQFFDEIPNEKADKDKLELAKTLIEQKTAPFDAGKYKDHYQEALRELIEAKLESREPEDISEPMPDTKVIDLMEALKRSVGKKERDKKSSGPSPKSKAKGKKKPSRKGRRAA